MLIYSITPNQLLLDQQKANTEFINIRGGWAECVRSGNEWRITRIISTDPSVFLNRENAPGCRLNIGTISKEKQEDRPN